MELVTKAEREQLEGRVAALIANRGVLSTRIAEARALGDLKENGDYHAAREQQGMDEAEIRRLQERLSNMSVIDEKMARAVEGVVFIGSLVRIQEMRDEKTAKGDPEVIKLVGEFSGVESEEYDEVTATSPMGEALIKTHVGEVVRVSTPRGVKMFKVVELV
jgi:transcription elongation factor GreA